MLDSEGKLDADDKQEVVALMQMLGQYRPPSSL